MKSIKQIVSAFNKTLTTRQASRKAQNERRKLQRRLANELSEELGTKVSWKQATEIYEGSKIESKIASEIYSDINRLKSQKIEGTNKRVGYSVELGEIEEKIQTRYPTSQVQERRNRLFTNELNQATKTMKIESGESIKAYPTNLNKNDVHGFYAATFELWKGVSIEGNRNKAIMREFGVKDLETVFKLISEKELNYKDFGFEDEEVFEMWIEDIKKRIDLDTMRKAFQDELKGQNDIPETKYNKTAIANIKMLTADIKLNR